MMKIDITARECSLILLALGVAENNACANATDPDSMLAEHAKATAVELSILKHWLGAVMRQNAH